MQEDLFWILLSKKICGEADAAELETLEAMIRENYELGALAERMQQIWSASGKSASTGSSATEMYEKISRHLRLQESVPVRKASFKYTFHLYATAAAIILVFVVSYFVLFNKKQQAPQQQESPSSEIVMSPGSKTKIQLPDGSSVWVNACSKIKYLGGMNEKNREVYLEGEAYFDVKRDPSRPFIVHTSGIDIKVLGTAFNVKAYKNEPTIEATLIHGSIEVINQDQPSATHVLLKPHEKLVYSKNTPSSSVKPSAVAEKIQNFHINITPINAEKPVSEIKETSWIYDKLIFEDERMEDLAIRMERWYGVKININDVKLKNHRISGTFVNETIEEALKELQMLINFSYSINNKEIIIK